MKRLQSPGLFPSGIGPKGPEARSAVDLASNQLNYAPALNRFLAIAMNILQSLPTSILDDFVQNKIRKLFART
jgi:hypothetical protein